MMLVEAVRKQKKQNEKQKGIKKQEEELERMRLAWRVARLAGLGLFGQGWHTTLSTSNLPLLFFWTPSGKGLHSS